MAASLRRRSAVRPIARALNGSSGARRGIQVLARRSRICAGTPSICINTSKTGSRALGVPSAAGPLRASSAATQVVEPGKNPGAVKALEGFATGRRGLAVPGLSGARSPPAQQNDDKGLTGPLATQGTGQAFKDPCVSYPAAGGRAMMVGRKP
jgi:hypothetical protein